MERILKQRDRLLALSARLIGLTSTAVALVLLVSGGALPLALVCLPLLALLGFTQYRMGASKDLGWPLASILTGLVTIVALRLASIGAFAFLIGSPAPTMQPGVAEAIRVLAACSLPAAAILLTIGLGRMIVLVGAFAATMITVVAVLADDASLGLVLLSTLCGWCGLAVVGSVLSAGLLRAARRVSSIGRAHRSERQASETEAQRRQGARLLHDTVLATLTLLAHSGVGVSREALRRQAGDDARLLRQLRLSPTPLSMGTETTERTPTGSTTVKKQGGSIETVRKRFARLGLDVSWHGAVELELPPARLEAFLLAVSECLENVRRHSGVNEAHVTITDDEATVRALVTDNGVGFVPADVPSSKLGYRESIVGRLEEVGGTARVFSAEGSGTTVVLEVPR
jgi:signal transduction histidine kinase